ncbi:MAG: sigma-70 family RNA polymerase sigma factor [Clostridiaceae bacterium]|nr:sigma-70 family RNA polymerase sigma factor [Clostridiaceae bacterium]
MEIKGSSVSEEEQVRGYSKLVRSCIRPYFLRGGDYDDLFQEGMVGLLSALRSYNAGRSDNFEAYAALCIKRRVIDALRKDSAHQRRQKRSENAVYSGILYPEYVLSDPEVSILASETAKEIKGTLSGMLSPFEASVLDCYLDGYTSSEIARRLKRSSKSVDNAIRRIRRKLALYLSSRR